MRQFFLTRVKANEMKRDSEVGIVSPYALVGLGFETR
jgi:hypothetical protein